MPRCGWVIFVGQVGPARTSCSHWGPLSGRVGGRLLAVALSQHSQACFLQKSTEHMRKVPTITLSITYKGVKFIDASNKVRCPCPAAIPLHSHSHPACLPSVGSLARCLLAGLYGGVPY